MKGKKSVYLIGPPHHQRIVYPVLEYLEKKGLKVVYLGVSQEPAYESFCIDRGLDFKYEYEYMDEEIEEKIKRYIKEEGKRFSSIYYSHPEGPIWFMSVMSKIFRWTLEDFYIFRDGVIKKEKPDFIVFQNESNMWSKLLGYIGYTMGIPVVSFQEGMYYSKLYWFKYHNNYSINLLLSKKTADLLIEAGSNPHRLVVVGNTYFDKMVREFDNNFLSSFKKKKGIEEGRPTLLIIISFADIKQTVIDLFKLIIEKIESLPRLNIIFKYHPIMDLSQVNAIKSNIGSKKHNLVHVHDEEVYPYLFSSDVCITTGRSTLVSEALALGKPVIDVSHFLQIPDYYGKYGVVIKPEDLDQIRTLIGDLLTEGLDTDMLHRIINYGKEEIGDYNGAISRAGEKIEKLINIKESYDEIRGYLSANTRVYKIGNTFIISAFDLDDRYIDLIYKDFKSKGKDFGVPLINGKKPYVVYEDNERPVITEDFDKAEAFGGVIVCGDEVIDRIGGWIDYKNPIFSVLDLSNYLYMLGVEGAPLDVNVEVEGGEIVPVRLEDEEDVMLFYVNNIKTRGRLNALQGSKGVYKEA